MGPIDTKSARNLSLARAPDSVSVVRGHLDLCRERQASLSGQLLYSLQVTNTEARIAGAQVSVEGGGEVDVLLAGAAAYLRPSV